MSALNLQASFFAIGNPWRLLDRLINPCRYRQAIQIGQGKIELRWTRRAERRLQRSSSPLIIELQLYFSCVVKKRVLFHHSVDFATTRVNERLEIAFRPIASAVCDPREFARHFPAGKDLSTGPAARMIPRSVEIDFRAGHWEGSFAYC